MCSVALRCPPQAANAAKAPKVQPLEAIMEMNQKKKVKD